MRNEKLCATHHHRPGPYVASSQGAEASLERGPEAQALAEEAQAQAEEALQIMSYLAGRSGSTAYQSLGERIRILEA